MTVDSHLIYLSTVSANQSGEWSWNGNLSPNASCDCRDAQGVRSLPHARRGVSTDLSAKIGFNSIPELPGLSRRHSCCQASNINHPTALQNPLPSPTTTQPPWINLAPSTPSHPSSPSPNPPTHLAPPPISSRKQPQQPTHTSSPSSSNNPTFKPSPATSNMAASTPYSNVSRGAPGRATNVCHPPANDPTKPQN